MSLTFSNDDNGNKPLYYLPVTLSANDGNGFQQKIDFDASTYSSYLSSTVSNINFQDGAGNLLYSWQETHAPTTSSTDVIYWLKLPNATITTVYIVFVATTASSISATHTGAEPNYSATYGQYDTGASVFSTLYQNFTGTSTPSGWSTSGTVTVDNGVEIDATDAYITTSATYGVNTAQILDFYASWSSTTGTANMPVGYGIYGTNQAVGVAAYNPNAYDGAYLLVGGGTVIDGTSWTNVPSLNVYSVYYPSETSQSATQNYANELTSSTSTGQTTVPIAFSAQNGGTAHQANLQWIRIRTYPSGGTMPTTSFGTVTAITSSFVSLLMAM